LADVPSSKNRKSNRRDTDGFVGYSIHGFEETISHVDRHKLTIAVPFRYLPPPFTPSIFVLAMIANEMQNADAGTIVYRSLKLPIKRVYVYF